MAAAPRIQPSAHPSEGSPPNLLTVDLEDWFHICEVEHLLPRTKWNRLPSTVVANTEFLLDLLERSGSRATFFVLGYVAERHPELIRKIHHLGHEIGYHGWDHELVYSLKPHEFREILKRGVALIQGLTGGEGPIGFRAPQWSINDRSLWALEILAEEGFVYDSSMAPLKFIGNESYPKAPYRINTDAGLLWEFPPLTMATPFGRYPAGGGWGLRCLPYCLLKRHVSRLNRHNIPAAFFFHPRELGCSPSISRLPAGKKFVLEARIWSSKTQMLRLVRDFRFIPIGQHVAWQCQARQCCLESHVRESSDQQK